MTTILDVPRVAGIVNTIGGGVEKVAGATLGRAGNWVANRFTDTPFGTTLRSLLESDAAKRTNSERPAMTIITKEKVKINGQDNIFEFTFQIQPKDRVSVSGTQNIAIFKSPGLRPEYQDLGPGESIIAWEGIMLGPSAWDDIINLSKIQESGSSIIVMFGPMMKVGVIRSFTYNINKFSLIQYALSILIEEDKDSQTYYTKFNPLVDLLSTNVLKSFPWLEKYTNMVKWTNDISGTFSGTLRDINAGVYRLNNLIDQQYYNWGSLANTPVAELYMLKREISSMITNLRGGRMALYSGYMNTQYTAILGGQSLYPPGRHE